ncbi:MFS general substrate transporter [Hypoxylon argillaceum]|nr:MFS general substrate transporter [Hypoxylon argillaceum]
MGKPQDDDFLPRDATREEIDNLVHEPDKVPITAWLLPFTGAMAQLARYGVTVTWQNYLQNPRGNVLLPGALGLGQSTATIIQNAFLLFQYITPLFFAFVSDGYLGRYKTMLISLTLLVVGYVILLATSIPSALSHGAGIGGFAVAVILVGSGQAGLSAVMYPLIGDQVPETAPKVKRKTDGQLVVTDRKLTIQFLFNGYYWMVNIAALSSIATTLVEKHVDFWVAYLLAVGLFVLGIIPVLLWSRHLLKPVPDDKALSQTGEVLLIACKSGFRLSAADPEYQRLHRNRTVDWSPNFISELRRGLKGCRLIICFIFFWLCYNQTTNNLISQAGQTEQKGISNDTVQSLNPIFCIILGPLIQSVIFPFLRRRNLPLGPIVRITVAFFFIAAGIAYASGLQQLIYSRGPCFTYPLECPAAMRGQHSGSLRPNEVNIWVQTPIHFLLAVGEILGLVALNEYTYSEAPSNAKAMVQAIQQLAAAIGSAFGLALGPVSKNPYLVILYASLAGTMAFSGVIFWVLFRKLDAQYEGRKNVAEDDSTGDISG